MKSNEECIINEEDIIIEWEIEEIEDESRVTAMYCFKNCDVNQN